MSKILNIEQAIKVAQELGKQGKIIVIVGGFFDILHLGHIRFLEKAKEAGDVLMVLLESDETAKKIKGKNRPINNQEARAEMLTALKSVDYVITLPRMKNNNEYDKLITQIKPKVFATTENDPNGMHKERQAKLIGGKIMYVIGKISNQSTSRLARIIEKEDL